MFVVCKCSEVQSLVSAFVRQGGVGCIRSQPTMCRPSEGTWLRFPEAAQLRGDTDREIILIGFHKDHLAVAELQGKRVMS